ncbi:tyrosine-type recombinase/integrase [Aureispira anguillae]|uniref:Tyrosine-type recombinase/integrase n=1 Tax=Aureispira anguillae TaxID=2864201 RepID=A0A915YCR0_9BACT|nr:tyrosine-type recombinase/integrase [Aureispira anguillae]BDS10688.1 tyrosine-type recombinase/integrase [Aureispira anguillae]
MTLDNYLQSRYRPSSVKTYQRSIDHYLLAVVDAETANYTQILSYLQEQRAGQKVATVHSILQGIKKYYNYLQEVGKREDNPAKNIHLKDYNSKRPILLNELLSREELDKVWSYFITKIYRYKGLRNRNLGMLSLLLNQGIEARELRSLQLSDLDLLEGKVFIAGSATKNGRTLKLAAHQILLLHNYVEIDRPKLQAIQAPSEDLFLGRTGKLETIGYLLRMPKKRLGGKRLSGRLLRKSVLADQFRQGKRLAEVQYLAGHKCPSSTERYQVEALEALQASVMNHHPLEQGKK